MVLEYVIHILNNFMHDGVVSVCLYKKISKSKEKKITEKIKDVLIPIGNYCLLEL